MKIHPVADLFPMMRDDDLNGLAADIKTNGLLNPIVTWVDKEGVVDRDAKGTEYLLDGRNRDVACKKSGVKPATIQLANGHDPVAFILSSNIARRHMTKGQQAMAVAMIFPEVEKRSGKKGVRSKSEGTKMVHPGLLSQARTVLKYLPEVAKQVLAGEPSLAEAYEQANQASAKANSADAQFAKLQTEAPDLANLVSEERMTIGEAIAAFEKRTDDEKERRQLATKQFAELINVVEYGEQSAKAWAEKTAADIDLKAWPTYADGDFSLKPIKHAIEYLTCFVKTWERDHGGRTQKKTHRPVGRKKT